MPYLDPNNQRQKMCSIIGVLQLELINSQTKLLRI